MTHKKEQGVPTPGPTQQVQVTPRTEAGRELYRKLRRGVTFLLLHREDGTEFPDYGLAAILAIESEAARSVPVAEGLREALENGMAYALARAALPSTTETSIEYAERLAPLVIESGFLATPPDPAEGQEPAVIDVPDMSTLTAILDDVPRQVANTLNFDGEGLAAWIVGHWAEYTRLSSGARRKGAGEP